MRRNHGRNRDRGTGKGRIVNKRVIRTKRSFHRGPYERCKHLWFLMNVQMQRRCDLAKRTSGASTCPLLASFCFFNITIINVDINVLQTVARQDSHGVVLFLVRVGRRWTENEREHWFCFYGRQTEKRVELLRTKYIDFSIYNCYIKETKGIKKTTRGSTRVAFD